MSRVLLALVAAALVAGCTSSPAPSPGTSPSPSPGGSGGGEGAPVADFSVSPAQGGPGTAFSFDASASSGGELAYNWNFGDGQTGTGARVTHTYTAAPADAVFGVTLKVTDGEGRTALTIKPAVLGSGSNALPPALMSLDQDWVGVGQTVNASAMAQAGTTDFWAMYFHGQTVPGDMPRNHMHMAMGAMTESQYTPEPNGFDSPAVDPGTVYTKTLTDPGLYLFHCHPHPWMVGAILVVPGAAQGTTDFAMSQARWFLPMSTVVSPGTTITWHNEDVTWHTVSLTAQFPFSSLAGTGASHAFTFSQAGIYELTHIVRDAKGAMNATSQLVEVSAQPPPRALHQNWSGTFQLALPNATQQQNLTLPYAGMATFALNWSTPAPAPLTPPTTKVQLDVFASNDSKPMGPSLLTVTDTGQVHLPAGDYALVVSAQGGAGINYEVVLDAMLEPHPAFATNSTMSMGSMGGG